MEFYFNQIKMKNNAYFHIFMLIWIFFNVFTAAYTELYADEAYYWVYSNFLEWGYFDHPPGIAFIIKLSTIFGNNELSVRLLNVVITACSIYIMYYLIKPKNIIAFIAIIFVSPILHIIGFTALPDGLFLFTNLLFLISYKRFIEKDGTVINIVFFGITAALMLYAKYQGVLVILFSILAVPRILLNYKTYLAGLITAILLIPHIYWQVLNNFPTFSYHLVDRASSSYRINHTLDFVTGNIFFLFGLISPFLLFYFFKKREKSEWISILKYNFIGTYLFFLLITFKGQYIEANWTISALFPLLYLGVKSAEEFKKINMIKVISFVFVPIMIFLQLHLVFPFFDFKGDRVWDFHRAETYVKKIVNKANDRVIVANRYQDASLINFYGKLNYWVTSLNINSRANQYSIWQFESDSAVAHDILFITNNIQSDEKIYNRTGDLENLNYLNEVYFPRCLNYEVKNIKQRNDILELSIRLLSPIEKKYLDDFSLHLTTLNNNKKISEFSLSFNKAKIENDYLSWEIETNYTSYDNVELKIVSKKLNGSNNDRLFYNIKNIDNNM